MSLPEDTFCKARISMFKGQRMSAPGITDVISSVQMVYWILDFNAGKLTLSFKIAMDKISMEVTTTKIYWIFTRRKQAL